MKNRKEFTTNCDSGAEQFERSYMEKPQKTPEERAQNSTGLLNTMLLVGQAWALVGVGIRSCTAVGIPREYRKAAFKDCVLEFALECHCEPPHEFKVRRPLAEVLAAAEVEKLEWYLHMVLQEMGPLMEAAHKKD